ncbi:MAG: PAS domain-containing protein, partial [Methylophilaceae bacterium]
MFSTILNQLTNSTSNEEFADFSGQLAAISKTMGVIEFDLKGNILAVNDNFAAVTGYSVEEIVGNHHSMFADAT